MKIKFLFLFAICGSQAKIGKYIKEYPKLSIKFAVDKGVYRYYSIQFN